MILVDEVAVVAHSGKKLGGGLEELRKALAARGYRKPIWYEVPKSKKAPSAVRKAVEDGATLVFVWGGDGMVQRCIDALAGSETAVAILPAGTGNLLASSLGIPRDVAKAVEIGLTGTRRHLDLGVVNGERFGAMAGTGFDRFIADTKGKAKRRWGRLAYLGSGVKGMLAGRLEMSVQLNDEVWFEGKASCLLIGNIGTITGGVPVFTDASPFDGQLDVGVVTARTAFQWLRVFSRVAEGRPDRSPLVKIEQATRIGVELQRKQAYELDGSTRAPVKRLDVHVEAGAVTVCVPGAVESA
jgi:YegS/Rv2252/BmrU family lipid kinase